MPPMTYPGHRLNHEEGAQVAVDRKDENRASTHRGREGRVRVRRTQSRQPFRSRHRTSAGSTAMQGKPVPLRPGTRRRGGARDTPPGASFGPMSRWTERLPPRRDHQKDEVRCKLLREGRPVPSLACRWETSSRAFALLQGKLCVFLGKSRSGCADVPLSGDGARQPVP